MRWQAQALAPTLPAPVRLLMRVLRVDLVTKHEKAVERLRATSGDVERVGGRKHNARWFREFLDADPRSSLGSIEAPVLAVTGDKDLQTPPQDVAVIGRAVTAPFEGQVIDGMNHILRPEPGTPSLSNYKKQAAQPLAPQLVRLVTDWAVRSTA